MTQPVWNRGDDPNVQDSAGRTPLYYLCKKNPLKAADIAILREILHAGGVPNALDAFGRSPLNLVCMETGNADALGLLLLAGADPEIQDEWGR